MRKEVDAAKQEIKAEMRSELEAAKEEIKGVIRSGLDNLRNEMVTMIEGRPDVAADEVVEDYETRRKAKFKRLDTIDQTNAAIIQWLDNQENTSWLSKDLISGPGKLDWDKQTPKKWTGPLLKRLLSRELLEERSWTTPHRTPPQHKRLPCELHDFVISVIKKGNGIDADKDIDLDMHGKLAKIFVAAALAKKKREGIPTKKVVKKARTPADQAQEHAKNVSNVNEGASTSKDLVNIEKDEKIISSSDEEEAKVDPKEKTASDIASTKTSRGRTKKRAAKKQDDMPMRELRSRK